MTDLPKLADITNRKLALKWSKLLDSHGLTGPHLKWHEAERNRIRRIAAQMGPTANSCPEPNPGAETTVDYVGIRQSVAVAEQRFEDLAREYWRPWSDSGSTCETFEQWLKGLKERVLRELASVWESGPEAIRAWYERACEPTVERAVNSLAQKWTGQSRDAELKRVESASDSHVSDEGAMRDLPVLSESTKRKLAVQWDTLRDKQKITDEDLSSYDRERQRLLLGIAADPPLGILRRAAERADPQGAARLFGLDPSVRAAEARFRGIDWEYWSNWCSSGFGYEVYRDWLACATRQVLDELSSIWKGRSAVTDQWFQATCAPAIEKALDVLVKKRIAQARDVETKRLEHPSKARTGTGYPVADGILTTTQAPEASRGHVAQHADLIHRPSNTVALSQDQQQRIKDADRRLHESLEAHEKMREIIEPGEWSPVSLSARAPRMADEVRKLDIDLRKFAIEVFNVLAEAASTLKSVDAFRTQLETHARELLEWILAKINPKDLPFVDRVALEAAIQTEESNWIRKAQREFLPSWMSDAPEGAPAGYMEPQGSSFQERDQLNALDPFQQDATARPARDTEPNGPGDSSERRFKKTGEVWSLQYDGTPLSLPGRIGMAYIEHLLRSPDRSFGCIELQAALGGNPDGRAMLDKKDEAELPVASSVEDEILDATARKQYKERLESIKAELGEAERNNDIGQRERLTAERQRLVDELKEATGLAGRPRTFPSDVEKARKAVSAAIRTALDLIKKHHPELAKHLEDRIDRGAQCCYRSDGIGWEV